MNINFVRFDRLIFSHVVILLLTSVLHAGALGQTSVDFPTIGKPMPGFILEDMQYYSNKTLNNTDLKGKWYLLDFWIMGCKPCIENFPNMSELVAEFKDRIEIIQVGIGGNELKDYYEQIRIKKGLKIPMAFDKALASQWQIRSYPTIFVVDNKGILRAITHAVDSQQLTSIINTGESSFEMVKNYRKYLPNDVEQLYFHHDNGGNDTTFLFRSVIAKATPEYATSGIANINQEGPGGLYGDAKFNSAVNLKKGLFQLSKQPLLTLYNTAYYGQDRTWISDSLYQEAVLLPSYKDKILWPILEMKDSSRFRVNYETLEGLYTYSLRVPLENANKAFVMRAMQLDLLKFFGYNAFVETRDMPVWVLRCFDRVKALKMKSKGGDPNSSVYETGNYRLVNVNMSSLLALIFSENQLDASFVDASGIDYPIDLDLPERLNDLKSVKWQLNKVGLDLIKGTKKMKVLVIQDPKE